MSNGYICSAAPTTTSTTAAGRNHRPPAAAAQVQAAAEPSLAQVGTSSPHLLLELSRGLNVTTHHRQDALGAHLDVRGRVGHGACSAGATVFELEQEVVDPQGRPVVLRAATVAPRTARRVLRGQAARCDSHRSRRSIGHSCGTACR